MTGVWAAWAIACAYSAWNNGLSKHQWPPPYVFLDATILFGAISLLARWNARIAGLLALGLVIPMVLIEFKRGDSGPLAMLPFQGGKAPYQITQGVSGQQVQSAGATLRNYGNQLGASFETLQPGG